MIRRYSKNEIKRMSLDRLFDVRRATHTQFVMVNNELVRRGVLAGKIENEVCKSGSESWKRKPGIFAGRKKD